jgi:hypothetical protein
VGWKLSRLASGAKSLEQGQETIKERLDEIARELLADFDKQVDEASRRCGNAVVRRRKMFAADLYQQFDLVQSLGSGPGAARQPPPRRGALRRGLRCLRGAGSQRRGVLARGRVTRRRPARGGAAAVRPAQELTGGS